VSVTWRAISARPQWAAAYIKTWSNKTAELSALWQGAEVDEIDKSRVQYR
jgi:hypothetical protein